jgi:hypothetical protein
MKIVDHNHHAMMLLQHGSETAAMIILKSSLRILFQMAVSATCTTAAHETNDSSNIHGYDIVTSSYNDEFETTKKRGMDVPGASNSEMPMCLNIMSLPSIESYQPTLITVDNDDDCDERTIGMYRSVFLVSESMVLNHQEFSAIMLYHTALANHRYGNRHSCSSSMSTALDFYHMCHMVLQNIGMARSEQEKLDCVANDNECASKVDTTADSLLYLLPAAVFHNQAHVHATFGNDSEAQQCHHQVHCILESWSCVLRPRWIEPEYMFFARHHRHQPHHLSRFMNAPSMLLSSAPTTDDNKPMQNMLTRKPSSGSLCTAAAA